MYANPGTTWACPTIIPCRNQLIRKTTPCNHSKTLKTTGEMLHKFIIVTQDEFQSNKSKKIQVKVQAGNSIKAIAKEQIKRKLTR